MREFFHLLVHSPNELNSRGCTSPKPGAKIIPSPMWIQDPLNSGHLLLLFQKHYQRVGSDVWRIQVLNLCPVGFQKSGHCLTWLPQWWPHTYMFILDGIATLPFHKITPIYVTTNYGWQQLAFSIDRQKNVFVSHWWLFSNLFLLWYFKHTRNCKD